MGRAVFVNRNLFDSATITGSSALTLAPFSNLQNGHVARVWAGRNGTTEHITIDFGSSVAWDWLMLAGLNLTAAGVTRVRASDTDSSAQDAGVYDSGSLAGRVSVDYGKLVINRPNFDPAQYARIDLSESGLVRVEAGRGLVGLGNQVGINFQPGWSRTAVNGSPRTIGTYGQTFVDRRPGYRTLDVTFEWLSEDERNGFVEEIENAIVNDGHIDLLLVLDPESDNLPRDSIWGYIDGDQPVVQPLVTVPAAYSKTYRVRERL